MQRNVTVRGSGEANVSKFDPAVHIKWTLLSFQNRKNPTLHIKILYGDGVKVSRSGSCPIFFPVGKRQDHYTSQCLRRDNGFRTRWNSSWSDTRPRWRCSTRNHGRSCRHHEKEKGKFPSQLWNLFSLQYRTLVLSWRVPILSFHQQASVRLFTGTRFTIYPGISRTPCYLPSRFKAPVITIELEHWTVCNNVPLLEMRVSHDQTIYRSAFVM